MVREREPPFPPSTTGPASYLITVEYTLHGKVVNKPPIAKIEVVVSGDAFKQLIAPILEKVGPYPHGALTGGVSTNGPKQTTRMIKRMCPACEYTVRTTQKWIIVGLPTCPCGSEMEEA